MPALQHRILTISNNQSLTATLTLCTGLILSSKTKRRGAHFFAFFGLLESVLYLLITPDELLAKAS